MLIIRLQRTGRKHEPTFRVVLTDSKNGPKSGKYLKNLGWYDTRIKNKLEQMDVEAIKHWVAQGTQLSLTLHNYLVSQKVISGKKMNALPKKSAIKKDAPLEVKTEATPATPASEPAPAA
jgi:small subunit ribosomal protein S16